MTYIVFAFVSLLVFWMVKGWILSVIRFALYLLYRFSGTLALIAFVFTWPCLFSRTNYTFGELVLLAASDVIFGAIAYAKFVGFILRSDNKSWWMLLLKWNIGLSAVIVFPIGILALILHLCFAADRA